MVKAKSQYAVDPAVKHLYQAKVLVPSPVPPHLIMFPDDNLEESKSVKAKSDKVQKSARATSVMISTSAGDPWAAPPGHSAGARKLGTSSNSAVSNSAICLVNCSQTVCRKPLDDTAKLLSPPVVGTNSREVQTQAPPRGQSHL